MPTSNAINVARACRAGLAGIAGFALVILPASLAEATYGPRTKIGTNYQQSSSTTSPNGLTEGSCDGLLICNVLFQVTPAQKALIVQHVSCRVQVSAGSLRYGRLGTRQGQTFPLRHTLLVPVPTASGHLVVNSPVLHLVESGERPVVFFENSVTPGLWFAECTISGQLQ